MLCSFDLFMDDFKSMYIVKSTVLIDALTTMIFL